MNVLEKSISLLGVVVYPGRIILKDKSLYIELSLICFLAFGLFFFTDFSHFFEA